MVLAEPGLMKIFIGRDRRDDENQTGEPSLRVVSLRNLLICRTERRQATEALITLPVGLRERKQQENGI